MLMELFLQSIGVAGIVIFYLILAKLSARMGEGLMLPSYYLWDYVAGIIALSTIPFHVFLHQTYDMPHEPGTLLDLQGLYILMLLISYLIVILVSFRYWWWLKDEIWGKKT